MRRPLFFKILLAACLSFFAITRFVWIYDSIWRVSPSHTAAVSAEMAISGASMALHLGGEAALRDVVHSWPKAEQAHLSYRRMDGPQSPPSDPSHGLFATAAIDPQGHRYAITYRITRFTGYANPPLSLDMGPHVFTAAVLGVLAFSIMLTLYLTIPISRIRAQISRLAAGDLTVRLGPEWVGRRDEIADLATDFNRMAGRMEELVISRDRLMADLSHELRSPLARLQLAIALAKQSPEKALQSLQRIEQEADTLEQMVAEVLVLSKHEYGAATPDEYFFLSDIAKAVVEDARFEAQEKGIEISFASAVGSPDYEALIVGSGKLVKRAVENVVRNALRYSRRGDAVSIEINPTTSGTGLHIVDQGPGVQVDQLSSLFEPFVQADRKSGQGYGLGLAIAKRAIIAHGGTIQAANGAEAGLVITIWLPSAPDADGSNAEGRSVWDRTATPAHA